MGYRLVCDGLGVLLVTFADEEGIISETSYTYTDEEWLELISGYEGDKHPRMLFGFFLPQINKLTVGQPTQADLLKALSNNQSKKLPNSQAERDALYKKNSILLLYFDEVPKSLIEHYSLRGSNKHRHLLLIFEPEKNNFHQ